MIIKQGQRRKLVWERDNYTCRYCGKEMLEDWIAWRERRLKRKRLDLVADHLIPRKFIPLYGYGYLLHRTWNLVASCRKCDKQKAGRVKYLLILKNLFINIYRSW